MRPIRPTRDARHPPAARNPRGAPPAWVQLASRKRKTRKRLGRRPGPGAGRLEVAGQHADVADESFGADHFLDRGAGGPGPDLPRAWPSPPFVEVGDHALDLVLEGAARARGRGVPAGRGFRAVG